MKHEVIEKSRHVWTQEPDKAKVSPVVKARSDGAQAIIEAGPFTWQCDLPPVLGGENKAPSPTAALLGALAGCAVVFVRDVLAPQQGVQIESVEAEARCKADFRGLLAMPDASPELQGLELAITVHSSETEARLQGVYQAWLERCPIYLALTGQTPVQVRFTSGAQAAC